MSALNELTRLSRHVFIGGEFRKSGAASLLDVGDPATEDKIGEIADTPEAEVAAAIAAANKAQKAWNAKNSLTRAELLHEAAHKMRALKPVLGEMMTAGDGQALQGIDRRGGVVRRRRWTTTPRSRGMKRGGCSGRRPTARCISPSRSRWAWW